MPTSADVVIDAGFELGEGPLYDAASATLYGVDVPRGVVWGWSPATGVVEQLQVGEPVAALAVVDGGGLLAATESGIVIVPSLHDAPQPWLVLEADLPTRCNDGRCDSRGRFLVGTMAPDRSVPGRLYRIDHDGTATPVLDGIALSNGLDWSPDGQWLYHVDSLARRVTRYAWDAGAGTAGDPYPIITIADGDGYPDGLTVDADGCLWVALWSGGQVRRYDPAGRQIGVVELPTPTVTSCAFGGPTMSDLFVTTAAAKPDATGDARRWGGAVFAVATGTRGQATVPFRRASAV